MKKGLVYCLAGVSLLGVGFLVGRYSDYIGGRIRFNSRKEIIYVRQKVEVELSQEGPDIPDGFGLEVNRIDLENHVVDFEGSDGYPYTASYDIGKGSVFVERRGAEVGEDLDSFK